jgi:effector-binding domain-containing protein
MKSFVGILSLFTSVAFADYYVVRPINLPLRSTVVIQARTKIKKLPRFFNSSYEKLNHYLEEKEVKPGRPFGRFFKYAPPIVEVEAGFILGKQVPGKGPIKASTLGGGDFAWTAHTGPYEKLCDAYASLREWLKVNGKTEAGPPFEIYLNDPNTTAPENLRTLIYYPFK